MSIKNGYVFNKDGIEYLCGLIRDMNSVSDGISDINIASNSTFSSLKIDNLIKQAIEDNNEYTDRVVSALTHLVAEKIDFEPTLDNTADKKNTLLLYSVNSNTTFNQYLRLENELLDLGTTSMDLSSYYTITQADSKFVLKTEYDSLVNAIDDINDTLGNEALTTTSQTVTEAINELVKARTNMEIIDLQGGSVLDFAKTFDALTYNSFYANNCYDLPNNENYGYCYVEVSQDPLYRNINFTSPTTGRKYTNTIGASTADPTIFGMWSGWHEELIKEDVVSVLDDTVTDEQVPSALATHNELGKKVDKTSIVTTLNDTVTDEQIPSAKALYDVWGEWSVISPIKEGYVRNSNGGGVSYYKQIKDMVIVTCTSVSRLIYTWNIGAKINEGGALPKPRIKIPVSIMSSNGEFYLAELDTDGYIKVKNREIPKTETGKIYYYSFNYITNEL